MLSLSAATQRRFVEACLPSAPPQKLLWLRAWVVVVMVVTVVVVMMVLVVVVMVVTVRAPCIPTTTPRTLNTNHYNMIIFTQNSIINMMLVLKNVLKNG